MSTDTEKHFKNILDAKTPDEYKRAYAEWVGEYEDSMSELGYMGPHLLAKHLAEFVSDKSRPVIDVGAGTGIGGICLNRLGFQVLDGIDLSPEMLTEAAKKGVYRTVWPVDLLQPTQIEDDTYAAAFSTGTFGTFTKSDVCPGPDRIPEVMRFIEPGGYFALTISEQSWVDRNYETILNHYSAEGLLETVRNSVDEYVVQYKKKAHYLILRKPD